VPAASHPDTAQHDGGYAGEYWRKNRAAGAQWEDIASTTQKLVSHTAHLLTP
jgi:hypothetical protein